MSKGDWVEFQVGSLLVLGLGWLKYLISRNNLGIFETKITENHIVHVVWTTRGPEPFASPFICRESQLNPIIALLVAANVPTAIIQTGQKKEKSKDSS